MALFANLFKRAQGSIKAFSNASAANALIGGSLCMAAADGSVDDSECEKTLDMARANPRLAGTDVTGMFGDWEKRVKASARAAKLDVKRLLEELKGTPEAEEILIAFIEVAYADGECDPAERTLLDQFAEKLDLKVSDYE